MNSLNTQELNTQELIDTVGGDFDWGDFFGGMLVGLGYVCYYTKNPYVCGASITGSVFYSLNWF